jgi:hypothetical protein
LTPACSSGGALPESPQRTDDPGAEPDPSLLRVPFLVDDYFVPNGCFGDGDCQESVIKVDGRACLDGDGPAGAQGVCRVYEYAPLEPGAPGYYGYLGFLFQQVGPGGESRIGHVPGLLVQPGAKRVVFWAKVGAGSVDVSFRAGGANNWEGETDPTLPYRDEFGVGTDTTLTRDYQQFDIDLSGVSYREVVSPFGWSISTKGRTDPITLYVADARWE